MCVTRPGVFRALALLVLCGSGNHEAARAGLGMQRRSFSMCDYSLEYVKSRPAAGCSGEGQAVLCVQTAKKRPHFH
jgi:hypothetical protein